MPAAPPRQPWTPRSSPACDPAPTLGGRSAAETIHIAVSSLDSQVVGDIRMLTIHNFSYGLLTPALAYLMSFLGSFLGLRCTSRSRVSTGPARARWLMVAGISIGITGIWVMHFIAMLGFTIPGETIRYNVPVTLLSMLIAVIFVTIGLLISGLGRATVRSLLTGGVITGLGVAAMHYSGMAAMRMPARMNYDPKLFALSIVIAIVAATAALWAALRLGGFWTTLGANAAAFLLPLIIGVSITTFVLTATIALSPTADEIAAEAELMARIDSIKAQPADLRAPVITPQTPRNPNFDK